MGCKNPVPCKAPLFGAIGKPRLLGVPPRRFFERIQDLLGSGSSQKLMSRLLWLVFLQPYKCDVHGVGYGEVMQALSPECDDSALFKQSSRPARI